jgi:hypothetical protein
MDTQTLTIQGLQFTAPAPYTEGHALTAGEALALNQLLGENLRNNFAARIKKVREDNAVAVKAGKPAQAIPGQSDFDAYAAQYSFGVRASGGGRIILDPIEREARNLVRVAILNNLKAKDAKFKAKDLPEGKLEELIGMALEKHPKFREQAARIVQARQAAVSDLGTL